MAEQHNIEDNRRKLYDALQNHVANMGSWDEFNARMDDEGNRRKVYEVAQSHVANMGSWDEFNARVHEGGSINQEDRSDGSNWSNRSNSGVAPSGADALKPGVRTVDMAGFDARVRAIGDRVRRSVERVTPEGRSKRKVAETTARLLGADTRLPGLIGRPDDNAARAEAQSDIEGASDATPDYGGLSPVVHGVKMVDGKATVEWLLPDGSVTEDRNVADMAEWGARRERLAHEFQKRMRDNGLDPEKVEDVQRQRVEDKLAQNEERLRKLVAERDAEEHRERDDEGGLMGFLTEMGRNARRSVGANVPKPEHTLTARDKEIKDLLAANDLLDEARRTLVSGGKLKKSEGVLNGIFDFANNAVNVFRGMRDVVSDPDFVGAGVMSMHRMDRLGKIKDKMDKGLELSDSELNLLSATALNGEVVRGADLPHGYRAGATVAEMLPFMAQMMLNPASGVSKAMAKRFGKTTARRIAATVAGDVAESAVLANTLQGQKTVADIRERHMGEVAGSADGGYAFTGGESWAKAIRKGEGAAVIENFTEMLGGHFGSILAKGGKAAAGLAEKMGAGRVVERIGNFATSVKASDWGKAIGNIEKRAEWHGSLGEILEEECGIVLNSLFVGDNRISDLVDAEKQIDIALGVGLFGGVVSAFKTGGYLAGRKRAESKLAGADEHGLKVFSEAQWDNIKGRIEGADDSDLGAAIVGVIQDYCYRKGDEELVLDYAKALMIARGYNLAELSRQSEELGDSGTSEELEGSSNRSDWSNQSNPGAEAEAAGGQSEADVLKPGVPVAVEDFIERAAWRDGDAEVLRPVTLKGDNREVYVVKGNIVLGDDGMIDYRGSDEVIYVYDAGSGKVEQVSKRDIASASEPVAAADVRSDWSDRENREGAPVAGFETETIQPVGKGIFGDIYDAFRGKVREAVNFLFRRKGGVATGVFHRDGVGDIDIVWGDEKAGLCHIIEKHVIQQSDFDTPEEAISRISDIIDNGEIVEYDDRVLIIKDGYRVVLAKTDDGRFVLTAYDNNRRQADKKRTEADATGIRQRIFNGGMAHLVSPGYGSDGKDSEIPAKEQISDGVGKSDVSLRDYDVLFKRNDSFPVPVRDREGEKQWGIVLDREGEQVTVVTPFALNDSSKRADTLKGCFTTDIAADELEGLLERDETGMPVDYVVAGRADNRSDGSDLNNRSNQSDGSNQIDREEPDNPGNPDGAGASEEVTALGRVPRDERGEPMFTAVDAETGWDGLVEFCEGDRVTAKEIADAMMEEKLKAFEKAQKLKAKGKTPTEILASKKENMAELAQAEGEYRHWQRMAGVEQARRDAERERQEAEARQAAAERAEAERAELAAREEAARVEREALNGVPEWTRDTPEDARARGYRRVSGEKIDRHEPVAADDRGLGREVAPMFKAGERPVAARGRVLVGEVDSFEPSHVDGRMNPRHFGEDWQPKRRHEDGGVSAQTADSNARNLNPALVVRFEDAFGGAPVVNGRREGIQGNGRLQMLRYVYERYPERAAAYKRYLIDHARELGVEPEYVASLERPIAAMMLDVDDEAAKVLGNIDDKEMTSGGVERIKPKNVVQRMGERMRDFAGVLLSSGDEEASMAQLVDANGVDALKWLNGQGVISDTQYASAFDSKGNLTAEAANDLKGILYQSIFRDGSTRLEEMFGRMPAKAQRAILATAFRDYDSAPADRMTGEIQQSIMAFDSLMSFEAFRDATTAEAAMNAVESWKIQTAFDDVSGEAYLPSETFSNFALALAAMYRGRTQRHIQGVLNTMFDIVQGAQEDNLFETADKTPKSLAEAVRRVLGIEYNPKRNKYDGADGGSVLAVDSETGEGGRRGGSGDTGGAEQAQAGAEPAERGGGTTGDIRGGGTKGDLQPVEERAEGEVDEHGVPFVRTEDGTTVFGEITEDSGLPGAPIKLSLGFQDNATEKGYGLTHIEANHGKQIREAGFKSVEDFVSYVAKNYDPDNIRVGKRREDGNGTFLIQVIDSHENTLYIELSKDGSYWGVNSGEIFRRIVKKLCFS